MADNGYQVVRAKTKNGDHVTTTRLIAKQYGYEVLEGRAAVDSNGNWLPSKPSETIAEKAETTKRKGA